MQPTEDQQPLYSIVLPARNEQERLPETLKNYLPFFQKACKQPFEVIVVANACTDRTVEEVNLLARDFSELRCVEMQRPGKGLAILEGFKDARGEIAIFCDSDGSTEAADVLKLLKKVEQSDCDCSIGSRWLKDSVVPIPQPLRRRIASRIFNLAVRIIFGFSYKDTQCGAKALNRKAMEVVQKGVTAFGYHFDCDMLWQLKKAKLKVEEIPITWRDCGGSGIQVGRDGIKMLAGLLLIRFKS